MFKFSGIKLGALAALTFGLALSFGASAFENLTPCWNCHMSCDDARTECVANGGGRLCFQQYRGCQMNCFQTIPNCDIP